MKLEDWTLLFEAIRAFFEDIEIPITEVMYWGAYVSVVLERRDTDLAKVPGKAGGIMCMYHYEDEMGRPQGIQGRRATDTTPGNPDHSEYAPLQPGVRIYSAHLIDSPSMFLQTTAGVLVKDSEGNEFMTGAVHGLPPYRGLDVMHPSLTTGRRVGKPMMEIPHTGITMVKLSEGEKFSNVTFQSDMADSTQLKKLCTKGDHRMVDTVYLDSPDTGCIEGTTMGVSRRRMGGTDETTPDQHWVETRWEDMGQGTAGTLPGKSVV